jgi:hypothetical protein
MTIAAIEKLFPAESIGSISWAELCEDTRIDVLKVARREQVSLKELAKLLGTTPGTVGSFMDAHGLQIGDSFKVRLAGGGAVRAVRKRGRTEDSGFAARMSFAANESAQREATVRNAAIIEHFDGNQADADQMVALVDLCDHHCRWPFDTEQGTRFCGRHAPAGQSYCAAHKAQSIRKFEVPDG